MDTAANRTGEELERLRREAREAGYADGIEAGRAAVDENARALSQLVEALTQPFRTSEAALLRSLVDLVERVAQAVLQRELQSGGDLEPVLRDALAALDDDAGHVELLLNPADVALLESADTGFTMNLIPDPSLTRGGLLLRSGASTVDSTLEARLEEAMASLRDDAGVPGASATDPAPGEAQDVARGD